MSEELKPCPFCGREAEVYFGGRHPVIVCTQCSARSGYGNADAKWNTRTPDPRIEKLAEALRDLIQIAQYLHAASIPNDFNFDLDEESDRVAIAKVIDRARAAISELEGRE